MTALLATLDGPDQWTQDAACRGEDIDLFFSLDADDQVRALRVCERCPVATTCLEQAIHRGESYGIWGGTRESERRRMIREQRRRRRRSAA